ncbi:nuclear transport factor 2 family protein [Ulvibacter litoralis]|uniref:SnoaL-like domain-containing protein n=1 Tax=Ulvibacter litoralis TaxID=227084 RepID=A0A1G7J357_9FLAO|nr:nuclear transport factor 2 family protein [Ulvibacter litoralis]GHC60686.1 hypothetical protein GCM10008083_27110 [Ulvibacter litoralis]SDF19432.1 hypothetical protein SAMN05421855_10870 [Ulvibacter litoralis]
MENSINKVIQNFLKYLAERNLEDLTKLFVENVDWYIPGDESKVEWLGKRNSRKEVYEFYDLLWKNTKPISANIDNIFINDNKAVITGEFSTIMLQTNKIVNSLFFIQITVENEKIVKYRLLEDSYAVSIALT